ncbi:nucleoside 2-deoxyribosyltransferase domain-containing protein [Actinokineospora sp. NBRC 105648]|uniref:NUDIX domain-containing protein n=1 Tax=Actinokineospora sp. NBRC 105648 TaxID=3032206 RepID=UPI002552A415|nr:nucleoside 2-deoxyribosyltransferase domain-containing protein [Actinokineospora sp. NBRC 105648]
MIVVHAGTEPPARWDASLFLAGPTPRSAEVASWRPAALAEIGERWTGPGTLVVFVPEPAGGVWPDYTDQRTWELRWGDRCDVVLFWIPRGPGLPALTTNDEFGRWKDSGRVVLGTPPGAESVRYQRGYAADAGIPTSDTLAGTVESALSALGSGVDRSGGERFVPLGIRRTPSFDGWYRALVAAGNELRDARQVWSHRYDGRIVFWALHVAVWVAAEDRVKDNELVLSRPDIASVLAYLPADDPWDTEVLLVREFRSPARTGDGFVLELPGGSAPSTAAPVEVAAQELVEETGLRISPARLVPHVPRQQAATMSAHRQAVFSVRLTAAEMDRVRGRGPVAAGTEITHPVVRRVRELFADGQADWSTLGAVAGVLLGRSPS